MNSPAPDHVALTEPEVEAVVLGTLISNPEAMAALASEINIDWFSDTGTRVFAEAALRIHAAGDRVTPRLLIANVPASADTDDVTRGQFVAHLVTKAVPLPWLSG